MGTDSKKERWTNEESIDQKIGLACPALGETNRQGDNHTILDTDRATAVCARHAPLLPMHDNNPAPDCMDKKKTRLDEMTPCQCCSTKL